MYLTDIDGLSALTYISEYKSISPIISGNASLSDIKGIGHLPTLLSLTIKGEQALANMEDLSGI